ncbi:HAD family hydrolase [Mucilaginibacter pallidiroseus]|uniref:HAD family hydrolase n=1 Tax=Mucilaginibacter pallidiroseus TaxID=2599295 RepID=A0A563UG75_9SPHI|nr:HAD family hydrolase [Mucilaginibacter pallidiroseus]TWR30279.1 HAD family hydrolase [Mucilaginibacter pallidiroseus]
MTYFKHYSFDLWLTLIKSNPLFKKLRSLWFYERYNFVKRPLAEVEQIFRQVDLMCNAVNEQTGKNIDADEMYLMIISLINDNQVSLQNFDIDEIYLQMEVLLFENLPHIYCNRTAGVLSNIKERDNTSINILSNTGFIRGATLRKVLHELGIGSYFDFQLYSDESGYSKPNKAFYQQMIDKAMAIKPIDRAEIIHIGDNIKTDYDGARAMGLNALLVNSNDTPITNLLNHASQNIFTS